MDSTEASGKTQEEALEIALRVLDVDLGEVEVEVINPGKSGFLGFGSEDARVRVTKVPQSRSLARTAKISVDSILQSMGISAISTIGKAQPDNPNTYPINIEGDDSGLLIGRRGETLRAFQFLVSRILANKEPEAEGRIVLDVEQYRQRRAATLNNLAIRMADRVGTSGRAITLEPMPSNERRVIHMTLAHHPLVLTESTGEGDERQVSISPKGRGTSGRGG